MFRFTIRDVFVLTTAIAWVVAFQLLIQPNDVAHRGGVELVVAARSAATLFVLAVAYVLLAAGLIWHWRQGRPASPRTLPP